MSNGEMAYELASTLQQAGVQDREFSSGSVVLRELPGTSIVRLRGYPDARPSVIGLPGTTGEVTAGDPNVLCIRPREWLLMSATASPAELLAQFGAGIDPQEIASCDTSDALAVFRLSGQGAPWLLNKLSGLDFQSGRSAGPHCARTKTGHIAVIVHYHEVTDRAWVFDLIFDRSMARYLWELLTASAPHADDLAEAFGSAP